MSVLMEPGWCCVCPDGAAHVVSVMMGPGWCCVCPDGARMVLCLS